MNTENAAPPAAPVEPPAQDAVAALRELVALHDGHPANFADHETPLDGALKQWIAADRKAWAAARAVLQAAEGEGK